MVAIQVIRESNRRIAQLPEGLVAMFLGATCGIGQNALIQFTTYVVRRIYIVARHASAAKWPLDKLHEVNQEGVYSVIEKTVSLVSKTRAAINVVEAKETKLDPLFESAGSISFSGRQETLEGLDASMKTRFYSRLYAAQSLLSFLNAAASPRVVSSLVEGQEAKLNEQDLDLGRTGNYSIISAAFHSAIMLILSFECLARENPHISFVHACPGFVATPLFSRGFAGFLCLVAVCVAQPLVNLLATSAEDAGEGALFHLTSGRYSIENGTVPLAEGIVKSAKSGGKVFLSNEKSESVDNEKTLADFRTRGVEELV